MHRVQPGFPAPNRRVVALGASNLTLLLPTLVAMARQQATGPVQVLVAPGCGRSFGIRSRFLVRSLPGIAQCGLWPELETAPTLPGTGIVMDVGNDILYGVGVPTILQWIAAALARLRPHVDRLVVAGLPPQLERVGPLRYGFVRTVLVPGCRVSRQQGIERAEHLRQGLEAVAAQARAVLVPMRREWFGIDPIHVRPRAWPEVCVELLGVRSAALPGGLYDHLQRLRLRFCRPQQRSLFGIERHARQPSVRLRDGTTVSAY